VTLTFAATQTFASAFDLGMVQAGFELQHKVEQEGGFGAPAPAANRHLLGQGWTAEAGMPSTWTPRSVDVVVSNPPCSGFSVGSNREFRGADSPINHCMWATVEYAARCRPQIVAFESVAPAYSRPDGRDLMQRLRAHLEELTGDVWVLTHLKHDAYAVGSVQTRRRYFWIAVRGDQPLRVNPTSLNTRQVLWNAIGDLESFPLSWEGQSLPEPACQSRYLDEMVNVDPYPGLVDGHQTMDQDGPHLSRMAVLLRNDWRQGETVEQAAKRYYSRNGRLPLPWTQAQADNMIRKEWRSSFWPTVRWRADRPAKVVHGGALSNAIHPTQPRPLTHREVARVMGFPDSWTCLPWAAGRGAHLFWGKGITVQCGRWLGNQLSAHLQGESTDGYRGELVGEREWLIDIKPSKVKLEVLM
jgi:site-specific DNA-cytosine methylase